MPSGTSNAVPGFLPTTFGFRFANDFPHVPVRHIGVPGVVSLPIGDASNGLCGGMAFAARDYFEVGRPPPQDTAAPGQGPLFDYLVDRLFDSFHLPWGPARYLELMNPALPDGETLWSRLGLLPHGRGWRMANREWPAVQAEIDAGHPSPLGLVKVKSANPFDLKEDHQVLAYGYALTGATLTLELYDPNWPGRNDVTLTLYLANAARGAPVGSFPSGDPVFAFFRVPYTPPRAPPP
jgi:hypothetical protein